MKWMKTDQRAQDVFNCYIISATVYYQSRRYCPALVAQKDSALWEYTLTTALLCHQNRTIPFGLIVQSLRYDI